MEDLLNQDTVKWKSSVEETLQKSDKIREEFLVFLALQENRFAEFLDAKILATGIIEKYDLNKLACFDSGKNRQPDSEYPGEEFDNMPD